MSKGSGGTRNYRPGTSTHQKRLNEYESLMSSGYDRERSYFSNSGGFKATHSEHNSPGDKDYAEERCDVLADKGYKVYLDSESSIEFNVPKKDGRIYKAPMDLKTINEAGKYTIKLNLEKATKQGASVVILIQNTKSMTREYVESQIKLFQDKSPKRARDKLEYVIVVGLSGNVHRHKLK